MNINTVNCKGFHKFIVDTRLCPCIQVQLWLSETQSIGTIQPVHSHDSKRRLADIWIQRHEICLRKMACCLARMGRVGGGDRFCCTNGMAAPWQPCREGGREGGRLSIEQYTLYVQSARIQEHLVWVRGYSFSVMIARGLSPILMQWIHPFPPLPLVLLLRVGYLSVEALCSCILTRFVC